MDSNHSNQRATHSRSATPDPSEKALEESLWMSGVGTGNKVKYQDGNPGSSGRAPPPPPRRERGVHSSDPSTPVLDVNELACSLTVDADEVSAAAQMGNDPGLDMALDPDGVVWEATPLGGEQAPAYLSHATMRNAPGEQGCEQFTHTSAISVDEPGTARWRDALSSSQRPTSVAASSLHNEGQSPAEVHGHTVRVDDASDSRLRNLGRCKPQSHLQATPATGFALLSIDDCGLALTAGPRQLSIGNSLNDLDVNNVAPHNKKKASDWHVIFNPQSQRVLDVGLIHSLTHKSIVCCVRFSHDGKYVATGCNRSAQIFDAQTGEKMCVLEDNNAQNMTTDMYIRSVCFSPDGRYLATAAEDKLIRVWDISSRTIRNRFVGHEEEIYSLDFARDGRTIASSGGDKTVRIWNIEKGTTLILTADDGVTTVAISPDTQYVAAGSFDQSVRVWDIHSGSLVERLDGPDGHKDMVYSVAFSPNGKNLISGSLDNTIKMWELSSPRGGGNTGPKRGKCVKTFKGHGDYVLSVAQTPDAKWILSGSKDRGVQFWDPHTGMAQLMLKGHQGSVNSVDPSPQGGYFATGSGDKKARIWSYRPYGS